MAVVEGIVPVPAGEKASGHAFLKTFSLWYNTTKFEIDTSKFVLVSRRAAERVRYGRPYGTIKHRTRRPALIEFVKACEMKEFRITPGTVFELLTLGGEWIMEGLTEICQSFIKSREVPYPPVDPFQRLAEGKGIPLLDHAMMEDPEQRAYELPPETLYWLLIESDSPADALDDDADVQGGAGPAEIAKLVRGKLLEGQTQEEREAAAPLILEADLDREDLEAAFQTNAVHRENMNFFIAWSASHLRSRTRALQEYARTRLMSQTLGYSALLRDRALNDLLKFREALQERVQELRERASAQAKEIRDVKVRIAKRREQFEAMKKEQSAKLDAAMRELDEMLEAVRQAEKLSSAGVVGELVREEVAKVQKEEEECMREVAASVGELDRQADGLRRDVQDAQVLVLAKVAKDVVDTTKSIRDTSRWSAAFDHFEEVSPDMGFVTGERVKASVKRLSELENEVDAVATPL